MQVPGDGVPPDHASHGTSAKAPLDRHPLTVAAAGVTLVGDGFGSPDNPAVVFLHGGGQTRHSWHASAAELATRGWYATTFDLRGHGDSDWSPDGVYDIDGFAEDVRCIARTFPAAPALVGASLGGLSSLLAVGESNEPIASSLVLVDVAPRIEVSGVERIRQFMRSGLDGFASLDEAADAVAAYNPHRPRPKDLSGLHKNLRLRDDGRWYWHWDPRFMQPIDEDEPPGIDGLPHQRFTPQQRLEDAARNITIPTLLVRGQASDLLSKEGARELLRLIPHAEFADVAGAGHMVAGDRNDHFNVAIRRFLRA